VSPLSCIAICIFLQSKLEPAVRIYRYLSRYRFPGRRLPLRPCGVHCSACWTILLSLLVSAMSCLIQFHFRFRSWSQDWLWTRFALERNLPIVEYRKIHIQGTSIKMPPTVFHHYFHNHLEFWGNFFLGNTAVSPTRTLYSFHPRNFNSQILIKLLVVTRPCWQFYDEQAKAVQNFRKRLQACVDKGGRLFEHSVWHISVPI